MGTCTLYEQYQTKGSLQEEIRNEFIRWFNGRTKYLELGTGRKQQMVLSTLNSAYNCELQIHHMVVVTCVFDKHRLVFF